MYGCVDGQIDQRCRSVREHPVCPAAKPDENHQQCSNARDDGGDSSPPRVGRRRHVSGHGTFLVARPRSGRPGSGVGGRGGSGLGGQSAFRGRQRWSCIGPVPARSPPPPALPGPRAARSARPRINSGRGPDSSGTSRDDAPTTDARKVDAPGFDLGPGFRRGERELWKAAPRFYRFRCRLAAWVSKPLSRQVPPCSVKVSRQGPSLLAAQTRPGPSGRRAAAIARRSGIGRSGV